MSFASTVDHPSRHQLLLVVKQHSYALNLGKAIEYVSEMCHVRASLKKFPDQLVQQSSEDPTDVFGCSYAADVLRCNRRLILFEGVCIIIYQNLSYTR